MCVYTINVINKTRVIHQRQWWGQKYFKPKFVKDKESGKIKARCVYCGDHRYTSRRGIVRNLGTREEVQRYYCNSTAHETPRTFTFMEDDLHTTKD